INTLTPATAAATGSTVFDGTGNAVQSLYLTPGNAGGGSFTLSFNGVTATNSLLFSQGAVPSPTAAQVQAALYTIGASPGYPGLFGNVTVIGPSGGPFHIVFGTAFAGRTVPNIQTSITQPPNVNEVQNLQFTGNPTGGTFTLSL